MRKLRLRVDELHVTAFETDPARDADGTVDAYQTQPDSTTVPCTGLHCSYPIHSCHAGNADGGKPKKK
jgi:hypothetical protein